MINDVFAPVVKTLFIPEGNPGVQEVKEIRAVPRVIQADGDAQEITVSGEMDLSITYVPINEIDDEVPWRTIQFSEEDDLGRRENEEQVIARLESALKDDQDEDDEKDQWFRIDISVPFTLAIDTDGFCREHIVKINPCIHSSNWFLVGPKAIEYEAVLQLASQEEARESGEIKREKPIILQMEELSEEKDSGKEEPKREDSREEDSGAQELMEQESRVEQQKKPKEQEKQKEQKEQKEQQEQKQQEIIEVKEPVVQKEVQQEIIKQEKSPIQQQGPIEKQDLIQVQRDKSIKQEDPISPEPICSREEMPVPVFSQKQDQKPLTGLRVEEKPKIKPKIQPAAKTMAKSEIKIEKDGHRVLAEKEYFQMKFYRVQLGEDLDAIADKFGIPRERISTHNSINEEEIRTGLLLSIPQS